MAGDEADETETILAAATPTSGTNVRIPMPRTEIRKRKSSVADHKNWLQHFFRVKPATRVIALNVNEVKGRWETYRILFGWKQYGMDEVHLDKEKGTIYGRVADVNCKSTTTQKFSLYHSSPRFYHCLWTTTARAHDSSPFQALHLRPVEFSAEVYTVLEHGHHANLSVARFRQHHGAASSFHKVVDTLQMNLSKRGLTVEDPARAKEMARVLDDIIGADW